MRPGYLVSMLIRVGLEPAIAGSNAGQHLRTQDAATSNIRRRPPLDKIASRTAMRSHHLFFGSFLETVNRVGGETGKPPTS